MPVLPGTASLDELGGVINDYSEVVDPTTDLPASVDNKTRAIASGLSRLAARVYLRFTNDGTKGILDLPSFDSVVGNGAENYPGTLRVDIGWYRLVFPATCTDALGNEQAWNLKRGRAQILGGTAPGFTRVVKVSPNVMDVYLWAANGTPSDLGGVLVEVELF